MGVRGRTRSNWIGSKRSSPRGSTICGGRWSFRFLGVIFLKDLLLQPWKPGRKRLRVLSAAGPLPPAFFPESERRPLRRYRSF
jgi:hypothetical protein